MISSVKNDIVLTIQKDATILLHGWNKGLDSRNAQTPAKFQIDLESLNTDFAISRLNQIVR